MSKKSLFLGLGIVIGLGLLWFALRNVEPAMLWDALARADWRTLPAFLFVLFLYYWIKAARWAQLLAPIKRIQTRKLFPALMIGYAVSSVLPMHLGEVARVAIVRADHAIRASAAAMTIAVERLFDLLAIPLLFAIAMIAWPDVPAHLVRAGYLIGALGLFGITLVTCFLVWTKPSLCLMARATTWLPPTARDSLLRQLEAASTGAVALKSGRSTLCIVTLTLLQWTMMWACIWLSCHAIGISASWSASMLTVALINVAVALPTTPGFVGSVQAAFVLALLPYGVSESDAVAASVYFHILAYASVVLVGFGFLHKAGRSLSSLKAAGAQPLTPDA